MTSSTAGAAGADVVQAPLPQVSASERRRRWRLVLGAAAEGIDDERESQDAPGATGLGASEGEGHGQGEGKSEGAGGTEGGEEQQRGPQEPTSRSAPGSAPALGGDDKRVDAALGALYDRDDASSNTGARGKRLGGKRAGGLGRSKPGVVRWLGDIRTYFPTPMVQIMQRDAVERLDLKQLLLEPELLQSVEPDIHMVTLLVELNAMLPDETRATARQVIAKVLADIEARLVDQTRQAVRGA
ncbi:MAG: hypothetical protein HN783_15140, partial [Ilumatobacter sp.]|nr:hypothetical protein [Ilumatobacter sp.]